MIHDMIEFDEGKLFTFYSNALRKVRLEKKQLRGA